MDKYSSRMFACLVIFSLLMVKSVWLQDSVPTIDLMGDSYSMAFLKQENHYYYMNGQVDSCLNRLESCNNGTTIAFNVSINYNDENQAVHDELEKNMGILSIPLISYGGDSPYAPIGFHLTQYSSNGDNYVEFGYAIKEKIYTIKLHLLEKLPVYLVFQFDFNKNKLLVYIDGMLYKEITDPVPRVYYGLNYNPYRKVRTVWSDSYQADKQSFVHSAFFTRLLVEPTDILVTGEKSNFLIGCIKKSSLSTAKFVSIDTPEENLYGKCHKACFDADLSQLFLISNKECACIKDYTILPMSQLVECPADGLDDETFEAYWGTHITQTQSSNQGIGLDYSLSTFRDPIEPGDPILFNINLKESNNCRVYINFDDGYETSVIGSASIVHEYLEAGTSNINLTVVSLVDPNIVENAMIEVRVKKSVDRSPINSVKIFTEIIDERTVNASIKISGGAPYSCEISFGDTADKIAHDSDIRLTELNMKHTYTQSGLYNISVLCTKSSAVSTSQMGNYTLIYLPNMTASYVKYQPNDFSYSLFNFKRLYIPLMTSPDSQFELELPFTAVSLNTKFLVVDLRDPTNYFEWLTTKRTLPTGPNGGLVVKMKGKHLKSLADNYFAVIVDNLYLATFLITQEESVGFEPEFSILNERYLINKPAYFRLAFKPHANLMIKVDFGDHSKPVYYSVGNQAVLDPEQIELNITHVYTESKIYRITLIMANHLNKYETYMDVTFEPGLPEFELTAVANVTDVSEPIQFVLKPKNAIDSPSLLAPNVKFLFDTQNYQSTADSISEESLTKTYINYTFDSSNDFSLKFNYNYDRYGYFKVLVNISNTVSYQVSYLLIKVGLNLNNASGFVMNSYVNINEYVMFLIDIQGGNGYYLSLDVNDLDVSTFVIPWSYIASKGQFKDDLLAANPLYYSNQLRSQSAQPMATFNDGYIYFYYSYIKSGRYTITLKATNPFGSFKYTFCTELVITEARSIDSESANCQLLTSNLDFILNDQTTDNSKSLSLAKGLTNTFKVKLNKCEKTGDVLDALYANWNSYWTLYKVKFYDNRLNYESMSDYCSINSSSLGLTIQPNQLKFGSYELRGYVYDRNHPENYVKYPVYSIDITQTQMILKLLNAGSKVELNWEELLVLDFYTGSYDPDAGSIENKQDLQFNMVCFQNQSSSILNSIRNQLAQQDFDFTKSSLNLAYQNSDLSFSFYENNCLLKNSSSIYEYDQSSKIVRINATNLFLNDTSTNPLMFYMIMTKDNRYIMSAPITVVINASSLITIVPSADLSVMADQLDALNDIAKADPKKAVQLLSMFADALNSQPEVDANATTAAPATDQMANLRGKMLNTADVIIDRVDDSNSVLAAVKATDSVTSNAAQMPTNNQEKGSYIFEKIGSKAKSFTENDGPVVLNIAESILGAGSNLFDAAINTLPITDAELENANMSRYLEPENDTVVEEEPIPVKYEAPLSYYEEDSEEFPEDKFAEYQEKQEVEKIRKETVIKKTSDIARRAFSGISDVAGALTSTGQTKNGSTTSLSQKNMQLVVSAKKVNESEDDSSDFEANGIEVSMPRLTSVLNDTASPSSVSSKMLVSGNNPYKSKSGKGDITGTIVSYELSDQNGEKLVVSNTKEPITIRIPTKCNDKLFVARVERNGINYHKLFLPKNDSSFNMVIIPECPGEYYHVYIKYTDKRTIDEYPDEKVHDYVFTVPNNRTLSSRDSYELRYSVFIANNETKGNGTYYAGVKLMKVCPEKLNGTYISEFAGNFTTDNSTNSTNSSNNYSYYQLRIFATSCKYWNESLEQWSTEGCVVGSRTTFDLTECHCYHLTTFGSDFYVPPNTIDFSTVFAKFKNLSENAAVFSTVIAILGVYIICGIIARHFDKRDVVKWGASPLCDNLPTDSYYYVVSVQTGVGKDSGTTSKVGFVLAGECADSGVRKLNDDKRKGFPSGSVLNFILSVEEPLGSLTHLRIWHDNSGHGRSKSWFLNVVDVLDLQTNEKTEFICHSWFAVEKGDGQIDRVIPVACQKELSNYKHLFNQSIKKKFTDGHLWFSIFSRPTRSTFTRLQRLSCCISLLFCTMIANAMFYKAEDNMANKTAIRLGPIVFSMTQLYTSIISTLIVVPVNIIIVTLFRKSKVKPCTVKPSDKSNDKHIAKKQYWRHINLTNGKKNKNQSETDDNIQSIELPEYETEHRQNAAYQDESLYDMPNPDEPKQKSSILKRMCCKSQAGNEYKRNDLEEDRNKKAGRIFPYWCIYIGWLLVLASILVPAFFVILYSMQWGKDRSNAWLVSMVLSFFQSLFVIDPIKVFIITAIIICILRKLDEDADSLIDSGDPIYNAIVNKDEEFLNKSASNLSQADMREIMNARKAKLSKLQPIDPNLLDVQRQTRIKRVRMNEILIEGASYLAFLIVLLFICHQSRSRNTNIMHKDLDNLFLNNPLMAFDDIKTRDDFWNYMNTIFLPNMYAATWYNNKTLTWREKLTIGSRNAIRVGAPRIRQLRIKENSCRVNPRVRHLIDHCRPDYNWIDDDTKDYTPGWNGKNLKKETVPPLVLTSTQVYNESNATTTTPIKTTPIITTPVNTDPVITKRKSKYSCQTPWCYQNTIQTKSTPIVGGFTTYKGGGYGLSLEREYPKSKILVDQLQEQGWIDELTRAVFLEFTVYNPNVNLFASATLIVEYLSTGAAITYQSMSAFQLYSYLGSFGILVLIFNIVFVMFFIYFLIHEILEIKKHKCAYFKEFWNLNELVIVVFSLISIIMFILRKVFSTVALNTIKKTELGEFVNFNTIAMWDDVLNSVSAVIVFCATLKFLKLLRFNKRIGMLAATLRYACKDVVSFSVTFCIIMFAFAQFGYLVFGSLMKSYSNFISSVESLFRLMLGQIELDQYLSANWLFGAFFFVSFIVLVAIGLVSMLITILNEAFAKVKADMARTPNDEIFEFMIDTIKSIGRKKKTDLKETGKRLDGDVVSISGSQADTISSNGEEKFNVILKEDLECYTPQLERSVSYLTRQQDALVEDEDNQSYRVISF